MSTEQQPKHKPPEELHGTAPKHDETILAKKLRSFWESLKSGTFWTYGLLLVAVAGVGGYFLYDYYATESEEKSSKLWVSLDEAKDLKAFEEIAEADADTEQGRVAKLERARKLLGPLGIQHLGTRQAVDREEAVKNIITARDLFRTLTEEFEEGSELQCQAYWGSAQAEESLVGVPNPEKSSDKLGTLDRVLEDLRKVAEVAPGSPMAKQATERAKYIEDNRKDILAFYTALNEKAQKPSPVFNFPPGIQHP